MNLQREQRGFSHLMITLLIVVIGVIALAAYSVHKSTKTVIHNAPAKQGTIAAPVPLTQQAPTDALHVATLPSITTTGWKTLQQDNGRITYLYPSNWQLKYKGFVYYGTSAASSDNKGYYLTLISPDGQLNGDYDMNYKKLPGAKLQMTVSYLKSQVDSTSPVDGCTILKKQGLYLMEVANSAAPICVGMEYSPSFYQAHAIYCGLSISANITLGGQNSITQQQADLQTMLAMLKTWSYKQTCTTTAQGTQQLFFDP